MTLLDSIAIQVERTNEQIRQSIPNDQGKAARSLRVEIVGNEVRSLGISYIEYLNRGSAPWANPDNYKKLGFILDQSRWAARNGVNPYAAAYSIAHHGSQIFQGKKQGIELEKKIEELKARLRQNIPGYVRTEIMNMIKRR